MNPFRIASIGAGHIANWGHGPSLARYASKHPDVELSAICDLDRAKAEAFSAKWGHRKVYTDIKTMLDEVKPDAVCLVVPEPVTARLAIPLLEQGIPLLLEKPPGARIAETRALVDAAQKGKGPHAVAFNRRHMPLVQALRKKTSDLAISIEQIRYEMVRKGRTETFFNLTAIHGLDLVSHLARSPVTRHHFEAHCPPRAPAGARNFSGMAVYKNGVQAQWMISPMAGTIFERLAVHGDGHSFYVNLPVWGCLDTPGVLEHYHGGALVSRTGGDAVSESPEPFVTNGFYGENAAFLDAVRTGRRPEDDLDSALESMALAEALEAAPWSKEG